MVDKMIIPIVEGITVIDINFLVMNIPTLCFTINIFKRIIC